MFPQISAFMSDLEKCKKSSLLLIERMPHILPHSDRVVLFRRRVAAEKAQLGVAGQNEDVSNVSSTLVTIHRTRIVEDGDRLDETCSKERKKPGTFLCRQLSGLSSQALKGVIRVKFVNIQVINDNK